LASLQAWRVRIQGLWISNCTTTEGFLNGRVLVVQKDKEGNLVFVPEMVKFIKPQFAMTIGANDGMPNA
jgi:hypothetical protein